MRRLVLVLIAASVTAACVIGPKQDDPASEFASADSGTNDDGSFVADTSTGTVSDTGTSDNLDAVSGGGDTASGGDTGKTSDAAGDAPDGDAADAPASDAPDGADAADDADASDVMEGG